MLFRSKQKISDSLIDYNDEVIDIEYVGERETIDITVTGDSLFFCNDILTKNSIGLAATCDVMCSIWQEEEDKELGQSRKQRQESKDTNRKILLGLSLTPLTKEIAQQLGYDEKARGLIITDIDMGSSAASKNLKIGDLIMEAQKEKIETFDDARLKEGIVREFDSYENMSNSIYREFSKKKKQIENDIDKIKTFSGSETAPKGNISPPNTPTSAVSVAVPRLLIVQFCQMVFSQ